MSTLPRLYRELADWWPLLSAPEDYAEEAEFYRQALLANSSRPIKTMLELGCGGGNNASHLKRHFQLSLVDLSASMLQVSQTLNPECEHIQGDMRTVRLGRQFDAVFIHDAISYMNTFENLHLALSTAFTHCKPGGVALFCPDHTKESFKPSTSHGGHDGERRSLRYLEWTWDADPRDTTCLSQMVYLLRETDKPVCCIQDEHVCGLFRRGDWLKQIKEVGFVARAIPFEHSQAEVGGEVFVGIRLG